MNFEYSDEQRMLLDSADRLGGDLWPAAERLRHIDAFEEISAKTWARMAELGWLMLPIAEADGGLGGSAVDVMALMEGLGRHLVPAPYVASSVLVPALIGGDPAAADVLAAIAQGSARAAAGLLEAGGGYDLSHVGLSATQGPQGWTLSGEKLHVEDGAGADWFVVSARTGGDVRDAEGIGLFLVPAAAPGLAVERFRAIDQHRHARLRFENVTGAIPVGRAGSALPVIEAAVDRAICANLAEAVGSMEAAHLATLEYLRTRKQFGVAIGTFQALQHRAVDMAIALEEARSMSYRATLSLDRPVAERRRAVSAAKVRVGQCGLYVGRQAVQLHGGVGFSDELVISHHLKRLMMLDCAYGSAEHHLSRFASAA
ncbi:acyl-CoA dehydrogenase family protein [Novosphingobium aerophilum]|uniref:acyl-CoA dehydrogenase family protein n=1 Tax=Novosphingobium TaxID=165696 RepID=UPI0012CE42D8|nr:MULTISPECIES: acyl-CoA dehydrogenase [unclassified Novosphingobium]MPS68365.1 acyl-CoA dehydrogenase [Novosphingobium sp.]WRT95591.1 acyl-CoA dehydrogenase [Novosphingobium sp. RL4]